MLYENEKCEYSGRHYAEKKSSLMKFTIGKKGREGRGIDSARLNSLSLRQKSYLHETWVPELRVKLLE